MTNMRRGFLKATLLGSALSAVGVSALASSANAPSPSNGVVIGKSKKKEITYKKTQAWEDFYKSAI